MSFVLPMFYVIYFFEVGLPILKVNKDCVENASDFVSSNKYNFSLIYTDNEIFIKKTELLFTQLKCMRFNLDVFFRLKCTLSLLILNRIVV